ncbi:MAG TPA: ATP-binding protein [Hyphomicrobiaceae bacterium]|nr:ATP-binding protein [Hyphomicrobiaceae bacterium]
MLLVASLACTVVLTVAIADSGPELIGGLRLAHVLAMSIAAGGVTLAFAIAWRWSHGRHERVRRLERELTTVRRSLAASEAIAKAEPQVLFVWEQDGGPKVLTNTLTNVPGLPEDIVEFEHFGAWLEPTSAQQLKAGLDQLFAAGRPFNQLIRTVGGGNLEADGRVAAGRPMLRFRDIAGHKRDLARIVDQHRQLAHDIRASRAVLNLVTMPVWFRGSSGRIEWVNRAYVAAVEAADDAEVRERQIEFLESRQRDEIARALGASGSFSKRLAITTAGVRRSYDVMAQAIEGGAVCAAIDVTAIETAASTLDRQLGAKERTLDRVSTAIASFRRDQRLAYYNEAFQKLWRLDGDWLATKPTHGEILDRLRELSRLPEAASYRDWRTTVITGKLDADGYWHLADGTAIRVMAEESADGGLTYLYEDETESIALASRYNALIDVQRETLDHLREGVALFATDGRLQLYNSSFASIWKLSRQLLDEGPHVDEIIRQCRVLADDRAIWSDLSRAVTVISDNRRSLEGKITRPDQSVIEYATLPLPDGATMLTFTDVTEKLSYERALIERNEALVAADRLKSQFISHVSYELRTPLTNIIGFSELLESHRTGPLQPKQREYLGDIQASSKTLLAIIDDILDLATIDAGALELRLGPVKVRSIVEAAILGVRDRAQRANIKLDIAIDPKADEVIADEARIRQVLFNLVSNAIGFSNPGGAVRVATWREAGMIAFSVEDKGVGIPKDQQRSVLERFVSRSRGSRHRGAGLGLSIVKSLVELHGGDMSLDSEPGKGTSVVVRFPENGQRPRPPRSGDTDEIDAG